MRDARSASQGFPPNFPNEFGASPSATRTVFSPRSRREPKISLALTFLEKRSVSNEPFGLNYFLVRILDSPARRQGLGGNPRGLRHFLFWRDSVKNVKLINFLLITFFTIHYFWSVWRVRSFKFNFTFFCSMRMVIFVAHTNSVP